MQQSTKDIIGGFVSGWTQVIIMQPFEIVKIRLQTQTNIGYYNGMVDCFKKIYKDEGLLSFYKGTVTPLIGIGFQASIMFFTFELSKRFFSRFKKNKKDRLPLEFIALSGAFASLPTSLIAAPVEHARIRIQIQKDSTAKLYNGSVDAAITIFKNYGIKGLYKGFFPTWGRQFFGQTTYFFIYESILRACVKKNEKVSNAPVMASLLGGAMAGVSFFMVAYPMDYLKTLMQTDNLKIIEKKYSSLWRCINDRYSKGGIKTFYTGIGVTLLRSFWVNAGGFFAFESTLRYLGRNQQDD